MADGGYRSYEALWEGGAGSTPPVVAAGYVSYEAFWLGGAAGYTPVAQPPSQDLPSFAGGGISYDEYRRRKRRKDNDEILFL